MQQKATAGTEDLSGNIHLTKLFLKVDPGSTPGSIVLERTNQEFSTCRIQGENTLGGREEGREGEGRG